MNLGKGIKIVRKELGISQIELANKAGVSQTFLSQIENGKRNYSLELINKLMNTLPVPNVRIIYSSIELEDIDISKRNDYKILKPILDSLLNQII